MSDLEYDEYNDEDDDVLFGATQPQQVETRVKV
jgi:hypothetical protein